MRGKHTQRRHPSTRTTLPSELARQKTAIARFVKEEHMQYPVLINGDSLASVYGGLDAMPTSIYVNPDGKVVAVQLGITSKDDMEENIKKTLGN